MELLFLLDYAFLRYNNPFVKQMIQDQSFPIPSDESLFIFTILPLLNENTMERGKWTHELGNRIRIVIKMLDDQYDIDGIAYEDPSAVYEFKRKTREKLCLAVTWEDRIAWLLNLFFSNGYNILSCLRYFLIVSQDFFTKDDVTNGIQKVERKLGSKSYSKEWKHLIAVSNEELLAKFM
jgi:hypothetical protein